MRQGTGYIFGLIGFCILTFGLCGNQVAFAKHAQEVPEATLSHDEAVDQLENFLEMVGELRSHVDRSQFDLDALLDKLDYDVDNIVQFVRQEIQFEQYPGLLRGAKGTLLSRAGNALDQAVLAASLLGSAGYDVRIARGKLDEVTAKVLVQQIAANVRVDLPAGDQAEFGQITDAILRLLPQSASEGHEQSTLVPVESTEPYLAAGGTARRLLGVLHEHGITLEVDGMLAEVWREAEDYFWIEYRSTASGVWTIAHPAFAAPDVEPANITVVQYLRGEVPAELQHRFRIQAFAGVIQGGTCRAEALMSAWERPVENLIGIPLSYINLPDAIFDSETDFDLGSAALSSDYFYPLLNWEAAGDSAIHKSGLVVPMDAAASAAGGFFSTLTDRSIVAASALGQADTVGSEDAGAAIALGAVWLDYTLIAPGGEEVTFGRSLARTESCGMAPIAGVVESTSRLSEADLANIVMEQSFMLAAGAYPDALIVDRVLESLLEMAPYFRVELDAKYAAARTDRVPKLRPHTTLEYLVPMLFYSVLDGGTKNALQYRASPSLVVLSRDIGSGFASRLWVDIVDNSRRTLVATENSLRLSAVDALRLGVWDTYAEASFFSTDEQDGVNAATVTDRALLRGDGLVLLTPENLERMPKTMTAGQSAQVAAAFDAGYLVIIPETHRTDAMDPFVWWKIDPRSGATLGMTADGRGGELQTNVTFRALIAQKVSAAVSFYKGSMALLAAAPGVVKYPSYAIILARTLFTAYTLLSWLLF
jgi:hypothetical protein